MGGKRQPTEAMRQMYDKKREDTLRRISAAIKDMKKWGEPVTKKRIMERAGVSSGTMSKPYVIELLKTEQVCQFANVASITRVRTDTAKELSIAVNENARLTSKLKTQDERIRKLQEQLIQAKEELKSIEEENERLRGQRQLLLERLSDAEIPVGNIRIKED